MKKINCVLLIDDDPTTYFSNESSISDLNIANNTKILTDAEEALNYLQNEFEDNYPELILLDIKKPGKAGVEFLEALDNIVLENKDKMKVVMLSSSLLPREERQSQDLGADNLICKPLNTSSVAKTLHLHFN